MRAVITLILLAGCGKEPAKSSGAHAGSATIESGTTKRSDELVGTLIDDGTKWKRVEAPFGTAELPDGDDWVRGNDQVTHDDGTTVALVTQEGIEPSALAELAATFQDRFAKNHPSYQPGKPVFGTVKGNQAVRIDAVYDDGGKLEMRAFLIITPSGRVASITGRTPASNPPTRLAALVDHVVATVQIK